MTAEVSPHQPSNTYMDGITLIPGMKDAVQALVDPSIPQDAASAIEFILEGLHLSNKLNREVKGKEMRYT